MTIDVPYKPKVAPTFFAIAIMLVLAVFMGHEALTNTRGLIISGIITLSVKGATIFYWCMFALLAAMVLLGIPAFGLAFTRQHRVTLGESSIAGPKFAWSKQPTVIPLKDIQKLTVQE